MNESDSEELKDIYVTCPHCNNIIEIQKLNCQIFRHGVYIKTGKQINPHMPKIECDKLIKSNEIYGCGKPFKVIKENNQYITIICDYI